MPGSGYDIKTKVSFLKNDDLASILEPCQSAQNIAGTKVTVTLGPASREVDMLVKLLEAGATSARVDLTYGSTEYHKQSLRNLQAAVRKTRRLCAVILDTFGRELVVRREYEVDDKGWPRPRGHITIKKGQEVLVTTDEGVARDNILPMEYDEFDKMCKAGDTLFVGRYLTNGADISSVYLDVVSVEPGKVVCRAQNDATLDGLLTVIHSEENSDGMSAFQANLPLLTTRDKRAIADITKSFDIDFVALTHTQGVEDVQALRQYLQSLNQESIKIIAKVENLQALTNFESVASEADAILLSRGNLGLDVPSEKVAIVQKAAITRCNILGKPVTLTRFVDTMTSAPRCTRAEATDVANAVLDGVDGIMLGAETLRGHYPLEAVTTVLGICRQAEQVFNHRAHFDFLMQQAMLEQEEGGGGTESPLGDSPRYSSANGEKGRSPESSSFGRPPRNPSSLAPTKSGSLTTVFSGTLGTGTGFNKSSSFGSVKDSPAPIARAGSGTWGQRDIPILSRAEAMASTAVRAADKVQAKLIIVYASSGRTASLVAKYRPPMPILTLVVPTLKSNSLQWAMQGKSLARQLLCMRGVIPIMSAPSVDGSSDGMLAEAVLIAGKKGLIGPLDHVVCLMTIKDSLVVKIVSMDSVGAVKVKKGSHHDLAGLSTNADAPYPRSDGSLTPPDSGSVTPSTSQVGLAAPNIGVKEAGVVPAMKLPGGPGGETTKD